jgi:hypothetical protein
MIEQICVYENTRYIKPYLHQQSLMNKPFFTRSYTPQVQILVEFVHDKTNSVLYDHMNNNYNNNLTPIFSSKQETMTN